MREPGRYYCLASNKFASTKAEFLVTKVEATKEVPPTTRKVRLTVTPDNDLATVTWEDDPVGAHACGANRMPKTAEERKFVLKARQ